MRTTKKVNLVFRINPINNDVVTILWCNYGPIIYNSVETAIHFELPIHFHEYAYKKLIFNNVHSPFHNNFVKLKAIFCS